MLGPKHTTPIRLGVPALAILLAALAASVQASQLHPWQPRPEKASLMVVSTHPDDEGIFFGGAIPYYTQVRPLPTVLVSMTSGDWNRPPEVREEELRNAAWEYGLRCEPIFPRFKDAPTATVDQTWDLWHDGVVDGDDVAEGRQRAIDFVAEQIRTYRPEVVITHDFGGEYGHSNHKAAAEAVAEAYQRATDPGYVLDGLAPWQTKKLYVHLYANDSDGDGDRTDEPLRFVRPVESVLYHDWSTPDSALGGKTPLEAANDGLAHHLSQGGSNLVTAWQNRRLSEYWGLYATTVGPDPIVQNGMAFGEFFQNIQAVPEPGAWALLVLGGAGFVCGGGPVRRRIR